MFCVSAVILSAPPRVGKEKDANDVLASVLLLLLLPRMRKRPGRGILGETVVVVTGCLGFIGSNLVSHLLERRNNRSQDDDVHENVIIIGIDVLDVEKGPYKKEDKRANLNRLMHIGKRRFVFIDRDISLGIELSMIERELRKMKKTKDNDFDAEDDSNVV